MLTGLGSDQNQAYRELIRCNEQDWAMYGDYNIPALGCGCQTTTC